MTIPHLLAICPSASARCALTLTRQHIFIPMDFRFFLNRHLDTQVCVFSVMFNDAINVWDYNASMTAWRSSGMIMTGRNDVVGEKPATVPHRPPQISRGLNGDWKHFCPAKTVDQQPKPWRGTLGCSNSDEVKLKFHYMTQTHYIEI